METSGLYTCLVTGGDIPFREDSNTKTVTVAGIEFRNQRFENYSFLLSCSSLRPHNIRCPVIIYSGGFRQSQLLHYQRKISNTNLQINNSEKSIERMLQQAQSAS